MTLPNDTSLQQMSREELEKLWKSKPQYSTDPDWVRVAKELRYRDLMARWERRCR